MSLSPVMPLPPAIDPELAWQSLVARDPRAPFVYAVTTTGVFCCPDCKSRRPLRAHVRFFSTPAEAQAAGFRPCKRCKPTAASIQPVDTIRAYIEAHRDEPIRLEQLGRVAGLSPFTVQRLFKQAMGVSPLHYQRALRAGGLRASLKQGRNVTEAIYDAGYGSSSRAYEAASLGMTPSRFAQGGKGELIRWASGPSPFGWIVVGSTARGICWLALAATRAEAEATLAAEFPAATLKRDPSLASLVESAIALVAGDPAASALEVDLRGTAFQLRVWQALRQIPRGETRTYSQLARALGDPNSTRAVARACALNRVSVFVPCHRVIGVSGSLTGYRWGVERKRQLLAAEREG